MTVGVVPQTGGLGDILGSGLGQGVSQALQLGTQTALNESVKKAAAKRLRKILGIQDIQPSMETDDIPSGFEINPQSILAVASDPEFAHLAPLMAQLYAPEHKAKIEEAQEKKEKEEKKKNFSEIIQKLEELKDYAGTTESPFHPKTFLGGAKVSLNRPAVQKRAQIKTLASSLVPILREMLTKGQINQVEFKTFMDQIPKETDSERAYQGKLDAFKDLLGIEKQEKNEKSKVGKSLSRSNAEKILKESGGDPEKARKRARELGYEF